MFLICLLPMLEQKVRIAFRFFLFHLSWSQSQAFKPALAPTKMSRLCNTEFMNYFDKLICRVLSASWRRRGSSVWWSRGTTCWRPCRWPGTAAWSPGATGSSLWRPALRWVVKQLKVSKLRPTQFFVKNKHTYCTYISRDLQPEGRRASRTKKEKNKKLWQPYKLTWNQLNEKKTKSLVDKFPNILSLLYKAFVAVGNSIQTCTSPNFTMSAT